MNIKQKVIYNATENESKPFFGLDVRIGPLETITHKINGKFLVIQGVPSSTVTVVDVTTEECAVFNDIPIESIKFVLEVTKDIRKCIDHLSHFSDRFPTLSSLKMEE